MKQPMYQLYQALAAFIFLIIAQKLFPSVKTQKIWRKESFIDLQYWLIGTYVITFLSTLTLATIHYYTGILGSISQSTDISYIKILEYTILIDFIGYWTHRLFHTKKLWAFHTIHHSTKEIDFLSAKKFHPVENILIVVTQFIFAVLIAGFYTKEIAIAGAFRVMYGYFVHSNLSWSLGKAGYIFSNPYFHRWHHTMEKEGLDKNFGGIFSAWDFIFGTAYFPKNQQPYNFGVSEDIGRNIWRQFVYPFEEIWGKKR